jgi:transglutaminase-like putative cysteine protease
MPTLSVQHTTRYEYARTVQLQRHRLVLRPREGHDLRIEQMQLRIQPEHSITWVRDVFGNSIAWVDFPKPTTELFVESEVVIARMAPFPAREMHMPIRVPYPVLYDPLELPVVSAYLAPSFPEDVLALQQWLKAQLQVDMADAEGTVLALARVIHQRIAYRRREEKGVQTPSQTLTVLSGSCRDVATLMMDCARVLGIAARFCSGYLHGPTSLAGRASTHAWAEIYLPSLGWRGFDPTLARATSYHHIVTGVSNHPRGVMPISGTYAGTPADFSSMTVTVRTAE